MQDQVGGAGANSAGADTDVAVDTGLICLATLLSFHDVTTDLQQLKHEFSPMGQAFETHTLVRAARGKGLKARKTKSSVRRIDKLPLPAIAVDREGRYFIIAKAGKGTVLVKEATSPPAEWKLDELKQRWTGEAILIARRASLAAETLKFSISWFLPAVARFKTLLVEVLIASFFLQVFGLVAPLFSQVVIDKVLVHRGLTTLDVLVVGLIAIGLFEIVLGGLRTYVFSHTTSRIDALLGARLFRHLLALPISYFESRPTGQTVARVRELENVRQFLTSSGLNRSVRDNFALTNPVMSMEAVMTAAKLAAAHEFILQLPQGYDTILEERGSNLSGGQRQRIAIARALATNPRVLVFDEATSALDYESEAIIQANMRDICRGRTVLLVAHRLSTVRRANRILVMDKGMIVADGPHDALVNQGGLYAELVRQSMG